MKHKKVFATVCAMLIMTMLLAVGACGKGGKTKSLEESCSSYVISAIEEGSFYNPSSVRVLSATYENSETNIYVISYDCTAILFLTIQGTNKLGGTINKKYAIVIGGDDDGEMLGADSVTATGDKMDVGKINQLLKQHWIDLGVIDG